MLDRTPKTRGCSLAGHDKPFHQKVALPKTKGTATKGTLLLLKSLTAFCMLGNVTALPTPTCGCSEAISEAISALRGEFQAKDDALQVKYDSQQTLINSLAHEVQDLRCSGLTDTAKAKKCKKVSKCTNAKHRSTCKKTCCEASSPPSSPSPPPPSPSPPPPSPSPPPPSPSSPSPLPPSPPPACIVDTFTTKDSLKTAVTEFNSNAASAIAKYGPIADWCVSAITDMSSLFKDDNDDYGVYTYDDDDSGSDLKGFNADISGWDTSSVTTMRAMFYVRSARALGPQALSRAFSPCMPLVCRHHTTGPPAFRLAPLPPASHALPSTWQYASAFNQPLSFDTSSVTDMYYMLGVRSPRVP